MEKRVLETINKIKELIWQIKQNNSEVCKKNLKELEFDSSFRTILNTNYIYNLNNIYNSANALNVIFSSDYEKLKALLKSVRAVNKKYVGNDRKDNKAKEKKPKVFSLYQLAGGKPGKFYSIKEFLDITKNAKKKPGGSNTDRTLKLNDGYVYEADSKQEISTLKKLIAHESFKRLRGQCINIPYRYGGKEHNYYPDFILLTQTNKIVIVEVKEISEMNTKQNLRKYEALKRYCKKHGYLYIMCDKNFNSFDKLSSNDYHSPVVFKAIDKALEEKGNFNYEDYKKLIDGQPQKRIKMYRKSIGIYIASHEDVKMIGDLTYKSAKFRIIFKRGL